MKTTIITNIINVVYKWIEGSKTKAKYIKETSMKKTELLMQLLQLTDNKWLKGLIVVAIILLVFADYFMPLMQ